MSFWLSAIGIGVSLGVINFLYWKNKGYTNYSNLYMSIIAFFALTLLAFKALGFNTP